MILIRERDRDREGEEERDRERAYSYSYNPPPSISPLFLFKTNHFWNSYQQYNHTKICPAISDLSFTSPLLPHHLTIRTKHINDQINHEF